jgi:phosphoribosylformylglycinamidine cyclo-ligase
MSQISYKTAGVDKEEGYRAVEMMKDSAARTVKKNVLNSLGGFGAMYELPEGYRRPVLVSGTDGVGTKLRIAIEMKEHSTIGRDLVAMCANDVLCHGARPLFFLDYYGTGHLDAEVASKVVSGISDGCLDADMALIGGETAEMPGIYQEDDYDLAGFCVGIVERDRIISGGSIAEGDVIIGLESSGVHSNGFSLVRKLLLEMKGHSLGEPFGENGRSLGDVLLEPTRIYVRPVLRLMEQMEIRGMAHITGGGFYENLPRMFGENKGCGLGVRIFDGSFPEPPIFKLIRDEGSISKREMFSTFNMGIGLAICVAKGDGERAVRVLGEMGEKSYVIGDVVNGEGVTFHSAVTAMGGQ